MKAIRKKSKLIAVIFCISFFIQSCTAYKIVGVTIEDAIKSESKVKILKKDGKYEKFYRVELGDDGNFYGKKWKAGNSEDFNVLIDTSNIQKVQLYDKKSSNLQTIALVLPLFIVGTVLLVRYHVNNTSYGF
jgi:hypothetical protein